MTEVSAATGVSARLQAHLGALPGGIGCRHLARERDGLNAELLVRLGLARPIVRGAPRCADHGCPWQPRCVHWPAFEPDAASAGPVAGVKYKPTPAGLAAVADSSRVIDALDNLPVAGEILALLAGGPATVYALHSHFLGQARRTARTGEGDGADRGGLDRVALGGVLDLLAELGRIARGEDGVTYALAGAEVTAS